MNIAVVAYQMYNISSNRSLLKRMNHKSKLHWDTLQSLRCNSDSSDQLHYLLNNLTSLIYTYASIIRRFRTYGYDPIYRERLIAQATHVEKKIKNTIAAYNTTITEDT
jgi:hypothetical protein